MLRWLKRILLGLVAVLLVGVAAIYVLSNRIINERHAFVPYPVAVPNDSATFAQGQRLVKMRCAGCHGDSLQGRPVFFDEPMIASIPAPNVPARLARLTDAEFAGFLRSGVRKDGTSSFVMPPPGFYHISDADLGALLAYLRSLPVDEDTIPKPSYRLLGRLGVLTGQFKPVVAEIDTTQERVGQDPTWATTRSGEYLSRLICSECNGTALTGEAGPPAATPSLAGALAYSEEEFTTLLRTGTPREPGKELGLMKETAQRSLSHLRDDEIRAIYDYLKALPASGVAHSRQ
ncbi:MAG TPA: cytochrome c [Gemmatimonadaceae bacterium]